MQTSRAYGNLFLAFMSEFQLLHHGLPAVTWFHIAMWQYSYTLIEIRAKGVAWQRAKGNPGKN